MASSRSSSPTAPSIAISKDEGNFLTTFDWNPAANPPVFGIAVLALRHRRQLDHRDGHRGPGRRRHRAVHLALRAAQAGRAPRLRRSTCSPPCRRIVYGIWGALFLVPHLNGLNLWLDEYFGWTYIFEKTEVGAARSLFTVGILLAIMILPIVTSVSREVFLQVPRMHEEAALALGATRWEVIRMSVLPFGRSGVISASMLGLGRALGETMAVATVLSPSFVISRQPARPGRRHLRPEHRQRSSTRPTSSGATR